mgnify:CR=1 FL=1
MLKDSDLYANCNDDEIETKNTNLSTIYNNTARRTIIEALLIDPTTPSALYTDLFGLMQDEVEDYRNKYFNISRKVPRIDLWEYIESLPSSTTEETYRKKLMQEVFYDGWETVDKKFNRNACLDLKEYGKKIFKEISCRVKVEVDEIIKDRREVLNISQLKTMMGILKEGIKLFDDDTAGNSVAEQLILDFVHDVQKSSKENYKYIPINAIEVDQFGIPTTSVKPEDLSEYHDIVQDIKKVAEKKTSNPDE